MGTFFAVVGLFWVGIGFAILQEEMKDDNKKVLEMPFLKGLKTFALSAFYGPFTRSRVVSKL